MKIQPEAVSTASANATLERPEEGAPWTPCSCVEHPDLPKSVTCALCKGLGLTLPADWLGSVWSILFMLPAESFGVRTPEKFLDLVLGQVYPDGGYRVLPCEHPKFAEAVKFVDAQLSKESIEHALDDAARGVFRIRSTEGTTVGDPKTRPMLVRHLRPLLLEKMPPARASKTP
jgi:hypothetical protein